jgi:hypothetical protein
MHSEKMMIRCSWDSGEGIEREEQTSGSQRSYLPASAPRSHFTCDMAPPEESRVSALFPRLVTGGRDQRHAVPYHQTTIICSVTAMLMSDG